MSMSAPTLTSVCIISAVYCLVHHAVNNSVTHPCSSCFSTSAPASTSSRKASSQKKPAAVHQRSPFLVPLVYISFRVEEQIYHSCYVLAPNRVRTTSARSTRSCSGCQHQLRVDEQIDHPRGVLAPTHCGDHQRCPPSLTLLVNISSSVDEQIDHFRAVLASAMCSMNQRGPPVLVLLVYISFSCRSASVSSTAPMLTAQHGVLYISAVCPLLSCLFTSAPAFMRANTNAIFCFFVAFISGVNPVSSFY